MDQSLGTSIDSVHRSFSHTSPHEKEFASYRKLCSFYGESGTSADRGQAASPKIAGPIPLDWLIKKYGPFRAETSRHPRHHAPSLVLLSAGCLTNAEESFWDPIVPCTCRVDGRRSNRARSTLQYLAATRKCCVLLLDVSSITILFCVTVSIELQKACQHILLGSLME